MRFFLVKSKKHRVKLQSITTFEKKVKKKSNQNFASTFKGTTRVFCSFYNRKLCRFSLFVKNIAIQGVSKMSPNLLRVLKNRDLVR
jgi:hypothetical protein